MANFPAHNIDPSKKDDNWILSFVRAAYNEYQGSTFKIGYAAEDLNEIRGYATGTQDINSIRSRVVPTKVRNKGDIKNGRASDQDKFMDLDYKALNIYPRIRRMGLQRIKGGGYRINTVPVDPLAQSESKEYFKYIEARIRLREAAAQVDPSLVETKALKPIEGEPLDDFDLELHKNFTYKHIAAVEMENLLDVIFRSNKVSEIEENMRRDLWDFGVAAVREWVDPTGVIRIRPVRLENLIVSPSQYEDFRDARYIGEIEYLTITELVSRSGLVLTEDEQRQLAGRNIGKYGNPPKLNDQYENFRVAVFDVEFYSYNEMNFEIRENRFGNPSINKAPYGARGAKYINRNPKVIYTAKWVVDSDYLYDSGLSKDMKREEGNISETSYSYHVRAIELGKDGRIGSIGRSVITLIDSMTLSYWKFQQARADARGKGIAIEVGAFENLGMGQGDSDSFDPFDALDLYFQRNVLLYRMVDLNNGQSQYKPITTTEASGIEEVVKWYEALKSDIELLREVTGVRDPNDGSERQGSLNERVEIENTSIEHIRENLHFMLSNLSEQIMVRVKNLATSNRLKSYSAALGKDSADFIKMCKRLGDHSFGIFFEMRESEKERDAFLNEVIQKQFQNEITFADVALIRATPNLKQAQQILASRTQKRRQESQQQAMAAEEQKAQLKMQGEQMKAQIKAQEMQMEKQLRDDSYRLKTDEDIRRLTVEFQLKKDIAMSHVDGKLAEVMIKDQGRKEDKEIDTAVKINDQRITQQSNAMGSENEVETED